MNVKKLYENRFLYDMQKKKKIIWQVLCRNFFETPKGGYIRSDEDILEIAPGYCEFINNVGVRDSNISLHKSSIGRRIAVDINEDSRKYATSCVEFYNTEAQNLCFLENDSIDVVFISNFFEHIQDKNDILKIMEECKRVLRKNGRMLILQPNIKYVKQKYWDFFDHYTPLTEKSMLEAINLVGGFRVVKCYKRFLPYTTKCHMPQFPFLIKLYCLFPIVWKIIGKQMYIIAKKE